VHFDGSPQTISESQGCQMVHLKKNSNLSKFLKDVGKFFGHLVYFTAI
jgi:hypothetical protein